MSTTGKPSGLKPPSKIAKPGGTGIPKAAGTAAKGAAGAAKGAAGAAKGAAAAGKAAPGAAKGAATDGWKIGDRAYVAGTKAGYIQFIGETQFAPGEWVGIVLDEPVGKNDGSVAGVRYFQCTPQHGVFSRAAKLTREPAAAGATAGVPSAAAARSRASSSASKGAGDAVNGSKPERPSSRLSTSTKSSSLKQRLAGSSMGTLTPSVSMTSLVDIGKKAEELFSLGDRVLVSGTKAGLVRYLGTTDFAKGEWVGVELEEEQGKNDGAVAGKRYFTCKPKFGLFAPVHKVQPLGEGEPVPKATPKQASVPGSATAARIAARKAQSEAPPPLPLGTPGARSRSGSSSSISSISSNISSASGYGKHSELRAAARKTRASTGSSTHAMQELLQEKEKKLQDLEDARMVVIKNIKEALKEKQQHVEQLLAERDMERAEVARSASAVLESQTQLDGLRADHEKYVRESEINVEKLRAMVEGADKEKMELVNQLEEERRKVEDLTFRIEEQTISSGDLEAASVSEKAKISDLEKESKEYFEQIEELTQKLDAAENKIKALESESVEGGAQASVAAIEIQEKENKITKLEGKINNIMQEKTALEKSLAEMKEEVEDGNNKRQKQDQVIEELNAKFTSKQEASDNMNKEMQELKNTIAELQSQVKAGEEKTSQLTADKAKLEGEKEEMLKNSGDSSQQLSRLNDQLKEKDKEITELRDALSQANQNNEKLEHTAKQAKEQAAQEAASAQEKHQEEIKALQEKLQNMESEVQKHVSKISKLTESHQKEMDELTSKRTSEMTDLNGKLTEAEKKLKELNNVQEKTQHTIEEVQHERDTLKWLIAKCPGSLQESQSRKSPLLRRAKTPDPYYRPQHYYSYVLPPAQKSNSLPRSPRSRIKAEPKESKIDFKTELAGSKLPVKFKSEKQMEGKIEEPFPDLFSQKADDILSTIPVAKDLDFLPSISEFSPPPSPPFCLKYPYGRPRSPRPPKKVLSPVIQSPPGSPGQKRKFPPPPKSPLPPLPNSPPESPTEYKQFKWLHSIRNAGLPNSPSNSSLSSGPVTSPKPRRNYKKLFSLV